MTKSAKIEQQFPGGERWIAWRLFLHSYKIIVDGIDKELSAAAGMSLSEFEILHLLFCANGRLRFIDIAKVTLLSQSRISRQIDALQVKGYLVRETTDKDRRATFAVLTEKGHDMYQGATTPFIQLYNQYFSDQIELSDLAIFRKTLSKLMQNYDHFSAASEIIETAKANNTPVWGGPSGTIRPKAAAAGRIRKKLPSD